MNKISETLHTNNYIMENDLNSKDLSENKSSSTSHIGGRLTQSDFSFLESRKLLKKFRGSLSDVIIDDRKVY